MRKNFFGNSRIALAGTLILALAFSLVTVGARPADAPGNGPPDIVKVVHIHYKADHAKPPGTPGGSNKDKGDGGGKTCAFKDERRTWIVPTAGVDYKINPTGVGLELADVAASINSAFGVWEAAEPNANSALAGTDTGLVNSSLRNERDGVNTVTFEDLSQFGISSSAIAVTVSWFNRATKQIVEVDITGNTSFAWGVNGESNKMDIWNIFAHEVGHFWGLGHVDEGQHTMYTYSDYGETAKRDLFCGDIKGIDKKY